MSAKQHTLPFNRLLAALSSKEREEFIDKCTPVDLVLGTILCERGDRIRHVYFPTESFISMLTAVDDRSMLEVGMIGNEGMCGHSLILGSHVAQLRALVQGAGAAWRMPAATFCSLLESRPVLRQILDRYVYVLLGQLAQTAACTRFHVVEKRLARWLLMTSDRAHSDAFDVTQEFLAFMLGVRRVGVTTAAGVLQSRKLISYKRGNMEILDRHRLEAASCVCYQDDLETYRQGMHVRMKSS